MQLLCCLMHHCLCEPREIVRQKQPKKSLCVWQRSYVTQTPGNVCLTSPLRLRGGTAWSLSDGYLIISVIQTATLKLVTTFSCHGEYQTGLCLRVREKHKSHSPAIKAARLETWECAECIFSISVSPLFSAHFVVMSFLTPLIAISFSLLPV